MKYENASLLTKKALASALCRLMADTPYSKISIAQITKECGLNRKTFYYHFEDKDALLRWTTEHDAREKFDNLSHCNNFNDIVVYVMDFIEQNSTFIADTLNSINPEEYKRLFIDDFIVAMKEFIKDKEKLTGITLNDTYRDFLSRFFASGISEMILYRLTDKNPLGQKRIVEYFGASVEASLSGIFEMERAKQESGDIRTGN